jgi:hypothetical protein
MVRLFIFLWVVFAPTVHADSSWQFETGVLRRGSHGGANLVIAPCSILSDFADQVTVHRPVFSGRISPKRCSIAAQYVSSEDSPRN